MNNSKNIYLITLPSTIVSPSQEIGKVREQTTKPHCRIWWHVNISKPLIKIVNKHGTVANLA